PRHACIYTLPLNATPTTEIYTLSLHDALPISSDKKKVVKELKEALAGADELLLATDEDREGESISWHLTQVLAPKKIPIRRMVLDRKSTRLNSSHVSISYAVFCLKKKNIAVYQ